MHISATSMAELTEDELKSAAIQVLSAPTEALKGGNVTAGILTSGLTPLFIRSMRTGPRHWRARGHREIT